MAVDGHSSRETLERVCRDVLPEKDQEKLSTLNGEMVT
jgi:hypothetical protein